MKGIFIHSKVPVDNCLTLSLLYKKGDFEMEAVTLNALPGCSEQLTYISGGGDKPLSLRYFKRAVFFFTNTQPEEERSLHQLKEKQFQMEVMLEFMTANKKDCTQAGSLEATPANPIFTALEPSLEALKQEVMNEASGKTERAVKFKELQAACSTNEEKHMKMNEETKAVHERFETVKTLITNINGITNQDLEKLKSSNSSTIENSNSSKSTNETTEKAETMKGKLEKLQSERSKLLGIMQHETEAWALDKLQILYTKLERIINKMEYAKNMGMSWNEYKLEKIKKHLKANRVGVPGESSFPEMLYDSPDAVHKDFEDIQGKISEYQEAKVMSNAKELYNKSCQEFADFQMEPYAFVKIDHPFQISWLFPHTGGYYLYDGSNPLPECEQRDMTIVLEEHLSITTEQLSLFQNLPSLESLQNGASSNNKEGDASKSSENNANSNVDKMVPVLSSSDKGRKVWYVNKNPLFLDDDGFHKMTVQIKQSSGTNLVIREWTRDISFAFSIGCYVMMSTMLYKLH